MAFECVTCGKSTTADGAVFCMYCGEKFSDPHATIAHVDSGEAEKETVPDGPAPVRVGGYRIVRQLGEGGMGSVYEAEADDTGKRVAVKLLSKKLSANPISVERFRQEGRLASQISHPRCVFVIHADADAGRPFIVMELMPGLTLKDLVETNGRLTPQVAVARILDVIDGLIEAHRLGLIHRDVKPSNCFITADDRVKIGDFGLSKSLVESEGDANLTGTGAFLGTVLYAPPEQIRGEEVSFDSDVYSVCATLFFLLTGRAPYQHESMTAALAKAISEPPPSARAVRPDVPRALDRVIHRGLERDRSRRYSSLEDLRDALQQLQPEEQIPARTRMLVAAYMIDSVLTVFLVQLPLELMEWLLGMKRWLFSSDLVIDPITWVGYVLYFAACEGFAGATVGKWLLGLRVVPFGSVGPPGFGRATFRSTVFHLGWLLFYLGFIVMAEVPTAGVPLGVLLVLGSIAFLAYRVRTDTANRGLHDLVTGCQPVQIPRRPHRVRLVSTQPNRLERAAAITDGPATVGGYIVRGKLAEFRDGSQIWLADDRSLGRRVILQMRPGDAEAGIPPTRPNRLRLLGSGDLQWRDQGWNWHAFAAPAGAPLADMIPAGGALNWPDARLLLEQIVEELQCAETDGTRPKRLSVNYLWCEPGGRVVMLDFPLPTALKVKSEPESLALVRQAATLMLEGAPRAEGGRVKAPLPPQVSAMMDRLFDGHDAIGELGELQCALGESHNAEPRVSTKLRVTQLGFAAVLLAVPMLLLALFTLFGVLFTTVQLSNVRAFTNMVLVRMDKPSVRSEWQKQPNLAAPLSEAQRPITRQQIAAMLEADTEDFHESLAPLSRPERYFAEKYNALMDRSEQYIQTTPEGIEPTFRMASGEYHRLDAKFWRAGFFNVALIACAAALTCFACFAFLFRGGLSHVLSGIALVRGDGRRAGRFRCAFREIVLWLPFMLALLTAAGVQALWPHLFALRLIASLIAFGVLVSYIAIGIRSPEQGPHDRLFGTWRVPA